MCCVDVSLCPWGPTAEGKTTPPWFGQFDHCRGCKTQGIWTMYGQDWPVAEGHRLGVLVSGANTDEFNHVATRSTVTVRPRSRCGC